MKLNKQQQQAVKHQGGPLLIVAGAGTGKTTVITERIKHLIEEKGVDPQHIFATTFTEKAASEIIERLDKVMPMGYQEPWLGTFHGLCDRILRAEGLEIGIDPYFNILSTTDQWIFIKEHLFDFELDYYRPLGNPAKFITAITRFFSRLQDEDVSEAELDKLVQDKFEAAATEEETLEAERLNELSRMFSQYNQLKAQHAVFDFGDLLGLTLRLFRTRPNVRKKYRQQFQHVLVDEFQDTNYAQYQLIKELAPADHFPNLVVMGDDDQAIFKFRGASVSNILDFKSDYPEATEVVLTKNYRSSQAILDAAYRSIQENNPDRLEVKLEIDKKLQSYTETPQIPDPLIHQFDTLDQEVEWTIQEISKLVKTHSLKFKDIAILARSNAQLEPYAIALKRAGLPYQLVSNRGLFDQPEVKELLFFLKVVADPEDTLSLFQFVQSHLFSVNPGLIFQLLQQSKKKRTTLFQEMEECDEESLERVVELIHNYQKKAVSTPVSKLLYRFIQREDYLEPFVREESVENQLKIQNLNLFFEKLKRFEETADDQSIINFLETLEQWFEAGENPGQAEIQDIDTITLSTIHSAKGLEYRAVFVPSLIAGRFPSRNRKERIELPDEIVKETLPEGNAHLQEERRLFYVALTRAKEFLYLTWAEDVGGKRKRKPSGFLKETRLKQEKAQPDTLQLSLLNANAEPDGIAFTDLSFNLDHLSYSQIDTFLACPLKYKYRYILKIPAPPHHSLSFGRTIHETLHQFHTYQLQGQPVNQGRLLELYRKNFIEAGYESPDHKKERFTAGLESLKRYFKDHPHLLGEPLMLEQSFRLKLNNDAVIVGKIDRIDQLNGEKHIVDYKTGSVKTQKEADKDDQLTIYALAAKQALGMDISHMSLYFVEGEGEAKKVSTQRTPQQLKKAEEKLEKQVDTIRHSDFPPKPGFVCRFCEYKRICQYAQVD